MLISALILFVVALSGTVLGAEEPGRSGEIDNIALTGVYTIKADITSEEVAESLSLYFPHIAEDVRTGTVYFEASAQQYEDAASYLSSIGSEALPHEERATDSDGLFPSNMIPVMPPPGRESPDWGDVAPSLATCSFTHAPARIEGSSPDWTDGDIVINHSDAYYSSSICIGIGIPGLDAWGSAIWAFGGPSGFTYPEYCSAQWVWKGRAHDTLIDLGDIQIFLRDFHGYYTDPWGWVQVAYIDDPYNEGPWGITDAWLRSYGWDPNAFINTDGRMDLIISSDEHYEVDYTDVEMEYGYTGCVRVNIEPSGAVSAGAKWYLDGNGPYDDNETVCEVTPGNHTVSFKNISCWDEPSNRTVTVQSNQTATTTGTYEYDYGSVTVTISPAEARSAGARWSLYKGSVAVCSNKQSGETCYNLEAGTYEVRFTNIACWTTPGSQSFSLSCGSNLSRSGTYSYKHSSVTVALGPAGAVADGARWSLYKGSTAVCTNKQSGETCGSLEAGNYEIRFNTLPCWETPSPQYINLACDYQLSTTVIYAKKTFNICVTIEPAAARTAGAQWMLVGDSWNNSGVCETREGGGSYTIQFKDIVGWQKCADIPFTMPCDNYTTSCTYTQTLGSIDGFVRAQTCDGAGVEGIEVCAVGPTSGCDITDETGYFQITGLQYGSYVITPDADLGHTFNPPSQTLNLDEPTERLPECFRDQTIFVVAGDVLYAGTACGSDGVTVSIVGNGQEYQTSTGLDGSWSKEVLIGPSYQVCVEKMGHSFDPGCHPSVDVMGDVTDVDFTDLTTRTLSGKVIGGCDIFIGQARMSINSTDGCLLAEPLTNEVDGTYSIDLPPRVYVVDAEILDDPLVEFDPVEVDLRAEDAVLDFVHRNPVEIEFVGFPDVESPCLVPVLAQGQSYSLEISVFERYGDQVCMIETGELSVHDNIGDNVPPTVIPIVEGTAHYTVVAGGPNILGGGDHPYQKQIEVYYAEGPAEQEQWVIVTGHRPREETFTTVTPELPLFILRDPPGDAGYSLLSGSTSLCYNASVYFQAEGSVEVSAEAQIGLDLGIGSIGGTIGGMVEVGAGVNVSREWGVCVASTVTYTTPSGGDVVGPDADVFGGAAINLVYAITDVLSLNENCEIEIDQAVAYNGNGYATTYLYTAQHIQNTTIPQLEWLAAHTADPESIEIYLDSRDLWQQMLDLNEALKADAGFITNRSFDAGTQFDYSETLTITKTRMLEFYLFINSEVAATAGLEVLGTGAELGVKVKAGMKMGASVEGVEVSTTTIGYHLEDDDVGDYFSVNVMNDSVFGTPVFDLVSGASSCPWEHPTQPREGVDLSLDPSERHEVPPDEEADFTLYLGNTSQTGEDRTYSLAIVEESNPDGAVIHVDGDPIPRDFVIPAGEVLEKTMTVARGPVEFDYPGLQLSLSSGCGDPQISDTATFSVFFTESCSPVTMSIPDNDWVVNQSSDNELRVVIAGYVPTVEDLLRIELQYTDALKGDWITAWFVNKEDLPLDFIDSTWDVAHLMDGSYDIRAAAICASTQAHSTVLSGHIDRTAPALLGLPEPADHVLAPGDEISFTFTEEIDPSSASANCCSLKYVATGAPIDVSVTPTTNSVMITANIAEHLIENQELEACVSCVTDLYGNPLDSEECWEFYCDLGPLHWSPTDIHESIPENTPVVVSSQLINSGPAVADFTITGCDICEASPLSGQLGPAGGQITVDLTVGPLARRDTPYEDTVYAETPGWPPEPLYLVIEVDPVCPPPGWSVNPPEFDHNGSITAAVFSDDNQISSQGDMLAAFVGDECRGVADAWETVHGDFIFLLTVYSNEPSGESFSLQFFDESECLVVDIHETFEFEADMTLCSLVSPCELHIKIPIAISIDFTAGWNWFSVNALYHDATLDSILASIADNGQYIKNQISYAEYVPEWGGWFGTLTALDCQEAYLIRMAEPDVLEYEGLPCPVDSPIYLTLGWNWISFLPASCMTLDYSLASIGACGAYIKDQTSYAEYVPEWGGWFGTLTELCPSGGYKLKMVCDATLIYPASVLLFSEAEPPVISAAEGETQLPDTWKIEPASYEHNASITAKLVHGDKDPERARGILGAFVDGECRGCALPLVTPAGEIVYCLTVHLAGAASEEVSFKCYDAETGELRDLAETLKISPDIIVGSAMGPFELQLEQGRSGAAEDGFCVDFLHLNWPDPFRSETNIVFSISQPGHVLVEILDVSGRRVRTLLDEDMPGGKHSVAWDAKSDSNRDVSPGIYFCRMTCGSYRAMEKVVLLR